MKQLSITTGNPVSLHILLTRLGEAFPVEYAEGLQVNLMSQLGQRRALDFVVNADGSIDVSVPVISRPKPYGVEIRGTLNNLPWRTYSGLVLNYTNATVPGPSEVTVEGDSYDISLEVQMNVPSDGPAAIEAHNQSEEAHPYILNLIQNIPQNVVVWEGVVTEDEETYELSYSIPDHTYSELIELTAQGLGVIINFKFEGRVLYSYFSVGRFSSPLFLNFLPEFFLIMVQGLVLRGFTVHEGDNDTIRLTWFQTGDLMHIPAELSQLTDDEDHRLVTDNEKTSWNNKLGASQVSQPTVTALQEWVALQGFLTAQTPSDWNASSGVARILNRPSVSNILYSQIDDVYKTGIYVIADDNADGAGIVISRSFYQGIADQLWIDTDQGLIRRREMRNGVWGAWTETYYRKPSTGIPKTDLAPAVQTSLRKADTALQTETDPTVPSWAKQPDKPTYTAQEVGALPANTPLFSGNYNDLSNKPTIPTVPTNVSEFHNDAGYLTQHQDISGKADKVIVVDASTLPASLDPNKVYQLGTLSGSVTIPPFTAVPAGDTEAKLWYFTFDTPATAPTITWPAAVTAWVGGSAPTINASKKYEVSVLDGVAAIMEI